MQRIGVREFKAQRPAIRREANAQVTEVTPDAPRRASWCDRGRPREQRAATRMGPGATCARPRR